MAFQKKKKPQYDTQFKRSLFEEELGKKENESKEDNALLQQIYEAERYSLQHRTDMWEAKFEHDKKKKGNPKESYIRNHAPVNMDSDIMTFYDIKAAHNFKDGSKLDNPAEKKPGVSIFANSAMYSGQKPGLYPELPELPKQPHPKVDQELKYSEIFGSYGPKPVEGLSSNNKGKKLNVSYIREPKPTLESKEGELKKLTPKIMGISTWKSVICKINDKKLTYSYKKNPKKVKGFLDFDTISVDFTEEKSGSQIVSFTIKPKNCTKIFKFKGVDSKNSDIGTWSKIVNDHVKESEGNKSAKLSLCSIKRFWRNEIISEEKFRKQANTLDIMLFRFITNFEDPKKNSNLLRRGDKMAAKFQRSLTGSEYDHVGVLLKYGNGDLVLLESTGGEGVGLCTWRSFTRNDWHLLYTKMVFRHLEFERDDKVVDQVEGFVKKMLGKKYGISAKKLMKKKSHIRGPNNENTKEDDERTFFCSELVAAIYKQVGLLPQDISAAQYWPGSFSNEKADLNLLKGAKLSDEYLIDFSNLK